MNGAAGGRSHASLVAGVYREHSGTEGEGQAGERGRGGLPWGRESGWAPGATEASKPGPVRPEKEGHGYGGLMDPKFRRIVWSRPRYRRFAAVVLINFAAMGNPSGCIAPGDLRDELAGEADQRQPTGGVAGRAWPTAASGRVPPGLPSPSTWPGCWQRRHFIVAYATARNVSMYAKLHQLGQLWQPAAPLLNSAVLLLDVRCPFSRLTGASLRLHRLSRRRGFHFLLHRAINCLRRLPRYRRLRRCKSRRARSRSYLPLAYVLVEFPAAAAAHARAVRHRAGHQQAARLVLAAAGPSLSCWPPSTWAALIIARFGTARH